MRNYYEKRPSPWPGRIAALALAVLGVLGAWKIIDYCVDWASQRRLNQELQAEVWRDREAPADEAVHSASVTHSEAAASGAAEAGNGSAPAATEPLQAAAAGQNAAAARQRALSTNPPEVRLALAGLLERNNDLVGWLKVEALPQLDIAVVQRDHTYYLRRDFYGRDNVNGTAFMDMTCRIWPRSDNLIIYAHNMKNGEMFGGLQKLRQEIFWRSQPMSSFSTLYEAADYVPVAVVLCDLARTGEKYLNFTRTTFADEAAFDEFIARARALSDVHPPYDVSYGDQLLTLVTCHGDDSQRLVVILRQVREGEDRETLAKMWT